MESKNCVYALRHNPTGKIYVGCSKNVERRVQEHITQLLHKHHPVETMQADFNTYGNDYSYFVLFEAFAAYDAFLMERHFMSLLNTRNPEKGYNHKDKNRLLPYELQQHDGRKPIQNLYAQRSWIRSLCDDLQQTGSAERNQISAKMV